MSWFVACLEFNTLIEGVLNNIYTVDSEVIKYWLGAKKKKKKS